MMASSALRRLSTKAGTKGPQTFEEVTSRLQGIIRSTVIKSKDTVSVKIPPITLDKGPVKLYGVGARYAQALYGAATKAGSVDQVYSDLASLADLVSKSSKFETFLQDPTIAKYLKESSLTAIVAKAKYNPLTDNLLKVLTDNGRLSNLVEVIQSFKKLVNSSKGEVDITIISALPLPAEAKAQLEDGFKKSLAAGTQFKIQTKENPEMLGGLIIDIGNQRLDLSVATELLKLRKWLEAAV
mmetsp:Transcript_35089/g.56779  ORF Transcript_35089/g.56779 Transcript_35089/m.56779 type:complete len:241 (-) Transcript_35089:431-1153(-)|eukprot:CAMPEP_0184664250 /NCGR_PEP_ID=MMETSP0308-20130426/51883_1 /TAXON_ID=38269 /ORGANISM="Gloeochaete witrockiana, Strain SAG 46.84" /LENGTH=240 /DNA_ID=CAMNT_0027107507 /DNA_START=71 /DNA_END=793 /DNA_ORIENTATION=-